MLPACLDVGQRFLEQQHFQRAWDCSEGLRWHTRCLSSSSAAPAPRQHVAFVYDNDTKTQSIYIDGTLDKTCSAARPERDALSTS